MPLGWGRCRKGGTKASSFARDGRNWRTSLRFESARSCAAASETRACAAGETSFATRSADLRILRVGRRTPQTCWSSPTSRHRDDHLSPVTQ